MEAEDGKDKLCNATHRHSLLLKEVRQLDRIDSAAVPEKLARLQSALIGRSAQSAFHAAEESILRWLLKSMSGNATNLEAEQFRRFPLAWTVMTEVIQRLPLQSLGRCLSDRKFVSVVQHVLEDIASVSASGNDAKDHATAGNPNAPHLESDSESSSRKRSRSDFEECDLATPESVFDRLASAEAVINTLYTVLARLDENASDVLRNHKAGADHVRSLFLLPAEESLDLILPILRVCQLATSSTISGISSKQLSLWIKTVRSVWDLHLRSHADYIEVAVRSSLVISLLLARLPADSVRESTSILDTIKATDWALDLRRFLIANMILPARNAFMERKDLEAIHIAVTVAHQSAIVCLPVVFSLVVESSQVIGGVVKTSFEPWVQAVFELLEVPIRAAPPQARRQAMQLMLQSAAGKGSCVSMNILTTVIEEYGILADGQDWNITELIARVDADVFLLPTASELLAHVLDSATPEQAVGQEDYTHMLTFVMLLAEAYARARDLVGFIKLWYAQLAERPVERTLLRSPSGKQSVWTDGRLSATIASLINSAVTVKQFEQISEWILSRPTGDAEPAAGAALIVIVACLADGIASIASEDAIGMRFFEAARFRQIPEPLASAVVKSQWHIATRTLTWTTLADSARLWAELQHVMTTVLKRGEVLAQATFSAFQCSVAMWAAFYPSAPQEKEVARLVASFLSRLLSVEQDTFSSQESPDLSIDGQAAVQPTRADDVEFGTYQTWLSTNPCHLFS
jgi:nucleolar pre-ribosomal-associated protein 2